MPIAGGFVAFIMFLGLVANISWRDAAVGAITIIALFGSFACSLAAVGSFVDGDHEPAEAGVFALIAMFCYIALVILVQPPAGSWVYWVPVGGGGLGLLWGLKDRFN